jgi:hypothetical protein
MSDGETPWRELVEQADGLPDGPAKLALLEEAVRLADAHGDLRAGYRLRDTKLISAAHEAARPDKYLVAFAWCLAVCDREPAAFDATQLCWEHFCLLLQAVRDSPDVPRVQAEAVLAEILRRLADPSPLSWALYEQAAMVPARLGDLDRSAEFWDRRCRLRHRITSSLRFDSQCFEIRYHQYRGDEPAALRAGDQLLEWARQGRDNGALAWTCAHLLPALLRAGRVEEAGHWQQATYREMRAQVIRLGEIGRHIEFLAASGDLDQAVRLLERHAGWLLLSREYIDLFHFNAAAWLTVERLRRERGPTAKLRLPKELACHRPDGVYALDGLAHHFGGEARRIANRYDERAGNNWFSRVLLDPVLALADLPAARPAGGGGKTFNKG